MEIGGTDAFAASRFDLFEQRIGHDLCDTDTAPGVDGLPVQMCGRDTSGRGDRDGRPTLSCLLDELVEHVGFAGPRGTGEEHVGSRVEDS